MTGYLPALRPGPFAPRIAGASTGGPLANGSNVVPSYVHRTVDGTAGGTGTVKCERMLARVVESPFWTGPLRSPSRLQNTFAHDCMMDCRSRAGKADPVEYRLRHLRDPRLKAVVQAAAKASNWRSRPSPTNYQPPPSSPVRGVACVLL